ncbi:protocatechuate 3,4-dioxygenase [Massilia sp. GER05]|uniref:protocatechuate 3,4-dioxygenase n=1 Tax=Massilia sp. GER05 TaxID=3394605 RepID=UPI003F853FA8
MSNSAYKITTSQTIGPFSHEGWQWAVDFCAAGRLETSAPTIVLHGVLYDGDGNPIDDAQIEAWLPEAAAVESTQEIPGFRRTPTGTAGEFSLRLSVPERPAGEPVAYVTVFARGLTKHQFTAVFLEDDATLAESAILAQVPAERRGTLIARKDGDGTYRWDIWMQTAKETVFFDYT